MPSMIWDVWYSPILTMILLNDAVDDVQSHYPLSIQDSLVHYHNHCDDAIDYAHYMYQSDAMSTEPEMIKINKFYCNGHLIKIYFILSFHSIYLLLFISNLKREIKMAFS